MGAHRSTKAEYDMDFFAWTQSQAELLRALRLRREDLPRGLDLEHLAEEVADLGGAELNTVRSLIRQIFVHLMKAATEPGSTAVAHWAEEASTFQADMLDRYTPSMRRRIDIQPLWQRARKLVEGLKAPESLPKVAIQKECPYSLDDLVTEEFSFNVALDRLRDDRREA